MKYIEKVYALHSAENAMVNDALFSAQIERIKPVTGKQTQAELATFFGIRQASVSSVVQRRKIPSSWLVTLMCTNNVHPEWILTGTGPLLPTNAT